MKRSTCLEKTLLTLCLGLLPVSGESLSYSINWASGLSLGEATLRSDRSADPAKASTPWTFDADLDVSIPGFNVRDKYHSTAGPELCSAKLDKTLSHGKRQSEEHATFDQQKQTVKRETVKGGHSDINVPACARDALAFLQFVRRELAEGKMAPQQAVVFGSIYQVRFEYGGVQHVMVGKTRTETERIQTTIKGPGSDYTIDVYFARDAARTPVLARLPLPLGTLTVELMR